MLQSEKRKKKQEIIQVLARPVRSLLEPYADLPKMQEIRLRAGKPLIIIWDGEERIIRKGKDPYLISEEEIKETINYVSNYSLYAFEYEMKQGYITIEGGHRVGMAGKVIIEQETVKNLKYISSVNIRISHEIVGCADKIFPYISYGKSICHTLIISPPGGGKTTMLRDAIRQISDGNDWVDGCAVGVVDERSEIGGCCMGVPQNDIGLRTDILDCCPKAEGMMMLVRSMAPRVIAVDEIGSSKDVHAIEYAMNCGCKMLASVHGHSLEEIERKPLLRELTERKQFERYIVLGNRMHTGRVEGIYNKAGKLLWSETECNI